MLLSRYTHFKVWINFQHFILCISALRNISENFFCVKLFAGVIFSGTYSVFSLRPFHTMFAFTKLLLLESLMVTVSTFTWSIIPSIPALMSDSNFQHFHFSLLNFHLYWPISSFDYLFLQNVTWVCHWETRIQHNYILYCLCVHSVITCSVIDHQATDFEKKWCDFALIMMHIFYLCSDLWPEERAGKFVICAVTHVADTVVTEIWIVVGGQILFNQSIVTEIHLYGKHAKSGLPVFSAQTGISQFLLSLWD